MKSWRVIVLLVVLLGLLVWYLPSAQIGGETLFYKAIKGDHLTAARLLLALGSNINYQDPYRRETALHIAIRNNQEIAARRLLGWGARFDIDNWVYQTPLDLAFIGNHPDLLSAMFKAGAKISKRDGSALRALENCLSKSHCSPKILELILSHGGDSKARDRNGQTLLHLWVKGKTHLEADDIATFKLLLAKGAEINAQDNSGITPLHLAAMGNPEVLRVLLANGAKVNIKNNDGDTPLHLAAASCPEAVKLLLVAGADVSAKNNQGSTPVDVAAQNDTGALESLLAAGAEIDARDRRGDTLLLLAARYFSTNSYVNLNNYPSPLFDADCQKTALANIKLLVAKGANVNARNDNGATPLLLMTAVSDWTRRPTKANQSLYEQGVAFLISRDAEVNPPAGGFITPLHGAALVSPEAVKLLLAAGAKVNIPDQRGDTPLQRAALNDAATVKLLLAAGAEVNAKDAAGDTPLHYAALSDAATVEALLAGGAEVNVKDAAGDTPLHWALSFIQGEKPGRERKLDLAMLEALLAKGADINAQNAKGETPLLALVEQMVHTKLVPPKADRMFLKQVVQFLVDHGAKINLEDHFGNTALKLTERYHIYPETTAFLHSRGTKE